MPSYADPHDPREYLRSSTHVDDFDINGEYVRLSADLAYWNEQYAHAYRSWRVAKLAIDRVKSEQRAIIRANLEFEKAKVTIAEVESLVLCTPQYQDAVRTELDAEFEKMRLFGVVDAVRAKKEMLVSLGAHMRAEMGPDMSLRRRSIEDEVVAGNNAF